MKATDLKNVNRPDCIENHTVNIYIYMKFYLKVNTDYGKTLF